MAPTVNVTATDKDGNTATASASYSVTTPPDLPLVTPLSAQAVWKNYGVCQHVNFQSNNVHSWQQQILNKYGQMSVYKMRSMYAPNLSKFDEAVAAARANGVKWHALVATIDTTKAEIDSKIDHMAANCADLIVSIEGINEPNEGTGWQGPTADRQRWIYERVRSHASLNHVKVGSCSMHDVRLDNSNGAHWTQFANYTFSDGKKAREFCEFVNIHGYPAGGTPDNNRAQRVQWAQDAFPGLPLVFSEWGYTNTTGLPKSARVGGHKVITEALSAIYDAQGILDFANAGLGLFRYEMMDDPDADKLETERNFGFVEVQTVGGNPATTWTDKPGVATVSAILSWLKDTGSTYNVTQVPMRFNAKPTNVRFSVVQKRNGVTRVYMWRHGQIWDPVNEQPIALGPVTVKLEDSQGERSILVGPEPVFLELR